MFPRESNTVSVPDSLVSCTLLNLRVANVRTAWYNGKKESINREVRKMAVQWRKDVEAAFKEAKEGDRPLLIDFSAAPG
jgi:hypothetical protein